MQASMNSRQPIQNVSAANTSAAGVDRTFSIAPMMECTDRHDRYLMRLMSKRALLYTEMVVTGALLYGDAERFLRHHDDEHPVALQLGGCVPEEMAASARLWLPTACAQCVKRWTSL